jgi:CubicO group peptidase (beta-lactamase class C family)
MWRAATVSAVNLRATAMSIARFYRVLLDGALPSPAITQFDGVDRFIGSNTVWGLGVQFDPDRTWGLGGLGGNAGWADPVRGQAVAYATRRLGDFSAVDRPRWPPACPNPRSDWVPAYLLSP